jgi:hypothetical protein
VSRPGYGGRRLQDPGRVEVIEVAAESHRLKDVKERNVARCEQRLTKSTNPSSPVKFTGTRRVLHR